MAEGWTWHKVSFVLGCPPNVKPPSDQTDFIHWLFETRFEKLVDDLTVKLEQLTTQPYE